MSDKLGTLDMDGGRRLDCSPLCDAVSTLPLE